MSHCRKHFFIIEKLYFADGISSKKVCYLEKIICKSEQYIGRPRKWYASDLSDLQLQVAIILEYFEQDTTIVQEYLTAIINWDTVEYIVKGENDIPTLIQKHISHSMANICWDKYLVSK